MCVIERPNSSKVRCSFLCWSFVFMLMRASISLSLQPADQRCRQICPKASFSAPNSAEFSLLVFANQVLEFVFACLMTQRLNLIGSNALEIIKRRFSWRRVCVSFAVRLFEWEGALRVRINILNYCVQPFEAALSDKFHYLHGAPLWICKGYASSSEMTAHFKGLTDEITGPCHIQSDLISYSSKY